MFYPLALPLKRRRLERSTVKLRVPIKDPQQLGEDPRYITAQQQIQQGSWESALQLVAVLQAEYQNCREITALVDEATLRHNLDDAWKGRIKERAYYRSLRRGIGLAMVLLLISSSTIASLFLFGRMRQTHLIAPANQTLLVQAQTALQSNQYRTAVELFRQILATSPASQIRVEADKGLSEAVLQLKLVNQYEAGLRAMQAQQFTMASTILNDLNQKVPNYRDTAHLLAQIQTAQAADEHFALAEAAYQAGQWETAVTHYEALRQLDQNFRVAIVVPHLATAYSHLSPPNESPHPGD